MNNDNKIKYGESNAGNTIYKYISESTVNKNFTPLISHINAVSSHVEKHLGDIYRILPTYSQTNFKIYILAINPTVESPYYRFITAGMSDYKMPDLEEKKQNPYIELMITLPQTWKLDRKDLQDDKWAWPILLLQKLAHFPSLYHTTIGQGDTIKNDDNTTYDKSTKLNSALISPSVILPEKFSYLKINEEKTINFYSIYPLYEEELQYKLDNGMDDFYALFEKNKVNDVIDPRRKNISKKKFWIF